MMVGHVALNDPPLTQRPAAAPERLLLDATERALRAPRGKLAMALHLSRLKAPGPLAYHSRIALALMQDTAQRLGGQVYPMRNTDLVLLCAIPDEDDRPGLPPASQTPSQPDPTLPGFTLPASLQQLFGAGAPDTALTTTWRLDQTPDAFRDYINERQAEPDGTEHPAAEPLSGALVPLLARLPTAGIRSLLTQQTAVKLRAGRGLPVSARLSASYRAFDVCAATLGAGRFARLSDAALLADPFARRHLHASLDGRIMALVLDDLTGEGPLTRPARLMDIPMHLALAPASVMSPGFARLAHMARSRGARLAVMFLAMDVAAEPALAAFAASLLRQAGFGLVLGGIDAAGLAMTRPGALAPDFARSGAVAPDFARSGALAPDFARSGALAPDLIRLSWSPRLADAPPAILAPVEAALAYFGPERVVLQDADGEAALIWAQSHGITQFQGPYLDAVQAASRIAICHSARACTLRHCTTRAAALEPAARAGCGNPGLLDMQPAHAPDAPMPKPEASAP